MKPVKNEKGIFEIVPSFYKTGILDLKTDHERAEKIKELSESEKSIEIIEAYLKKFSVETVYILCMMDSTGRSLSSLEWDSHNWQTYMEVFWYDV